MRTNIPAQTLADFNTALATKPETRVRIYKNRVFFGGADLVTTHAPGWAGVPGIEANPTSQDFKFNLEIGKPFTVINYLTTLACGPIDRDFVFLTSGGNAINTSASCRPSVWSDATTTVIYYIGSDINVHRLVVDADLIDVGTAEAVISDEVVMAVPDLASVHALSDTECVVLDLYEGGVRVTYASKSGTWSTQVWPHRFMHPTHVYSNFNQADQFALNFSGAVKKGESVLVYFSGFDGNVWGIERKSDGSWTDPFEAVPADLSVFKISNVLLAPNGRVHLVGQFQRVDPQDAFSSSWVYCLDLWSYEGRAFSLDRFTLFALGDTSDIGNYPLGYRFQMCVEPGTPDNVYFSDTNRYLTDESIYSVSDENCTTLTIPDDDVIGVSGGDTYTIKIANGLEVYLNHVLFKNGNVAKIDLGANGTYFQYMETIIQEVVSGISDGKRSLELHSLPSSFWRASTLTHPYYIEIQSKQSIYDDGAEWDNLYDISGLAGLPTFVMVDLWAEGAFDPKTHGPAAFDDHWGPDLSGVYADYPEVDSIPFDVHIYGWSRAGIPTPYDGGSDAPSDPNAPNDNFYALLEVEHADGTDETIVLSTASSGQLYPPQTYATTRAGSYPVILTTTGSTLVVGDKIKKVGVRAANTSVGAENTVYYLERVEIPSVTARIPDIGDTWEEEGTNQKLLQIGAPVIMLSQKPYSTFNCEVAAEYTLAGTGAWGGVICLSDDLGKNYIGGRISIDKAQIIKVRNEAVTVLAEVAYANPGTSWVMLSHRDGQLRLYTRSSTGWTLEVTYDWTEADGPMASDADLMHVGIYALRDSAWMQICSFQAGNDVDALGMLPGGDFASFPASGNILIDGVKYSYTGKTSFGGTIRGPFQARNTGLDWSYSMDGQSYSGNSVEFTLFEWLTNSVDYAKYAGAVMASDNAYAWPITSTDFKAGITTGGVAVTLKNRSRHFGTGVEGDHLGMNQKVWVTEALTGLKLIDGEATLHSEGSLAFLDTNSSVLFGQFFASSGAEDCTAEDMLERVMQMAGGASVFPGDVIVASQGLSGTPWRIQ